MQTHDKHRNFLIHFAYWASVTIIILAFLYFLLKPLVPFIIAFSVAAVLQPVMRWCQKRWKIAEGVLAAGLTVLCYTLLVGLVLLLLIGLFTALIDWASGLPELFTGTVSPWIEKSSSDALSFLSRLDPQMGAYVQDMLPDALASLGSTVMDFSVSLVSWASSVGTKLPGAMLAAVICVIATVFVSRDYEQIIKAVLNMFPERGRAMIVQSGYAIVEILGKFARSYVLILFITFVEVFIGLVFIGFENAAVIAALIAVFDILPIVGSGMVLLPWTVFTFIQGDIKRGIGLLLLYLFVVIARQVIEPRIVSKRVGLHPLSTLLFMWLGLKLFGGVGMLALPICVLILKDLHESGLLSNIVDPENVNLPCTCPDGPEEPQQSEEEEKS